MPTTSRKPRIVVTPANLPRLRKRARISTAHLARLAGCSEEAIVRYESGVPLPKKSTDQIREALRPRISPASTPQKKQPGIGKFARVDPESWQDLPTTPGVLILFDLSERPIYVGESTNLRDLVRAGRKLQWFSYPLVTKIGYSEVEDDNLRHQALDLLQRTCKVCLLAGPIVV